MNQRIKICVFRVSLCDSKTRHSKKLQKTTKSFETHGVKYFCKKRPSSNLLFKFSQLSSLSSGQRTLTIVHLATINKNENASTNSKKQALALSELCLLVLLAVKKIQGHWNCTERPNHVAEINDQANTTYPSWFVWIHQNTVTKMTTVQRLTQRNLSANETARFFR